MVWLLQRASMEKTDDCEDDQSSWTMPDEADNGLISQPGSLAMAKIQSR